MGGTPTAPGLFIAQLSHSRSAELHFNASGQVSQQFTVTVDAWEQSRQSSGKASVASRSALRSGNRRWEVESGRSNEGRWPRGTDIRSRTIGYRLFCFQHKQEASASTAEMPLISKPGLYSFSYFFICMSTHAPKLYAIHCKQSARPYMFAKNAHQKHVRQNLGSKLFFQHIHAFDFIFFHSTTSTRFMRYRETAFTAC